MVTLFDCQHSPSPPLPHCYFIRWATPSVAMPPPPPPPHGYFCLLGNTSVIPSPSPHAYFIRWSTSAVAPPPAPMITLCDCVSSLFGCWVLNLLAVVVFSLFWLLPWTCLLWLCFPEYYGCWVLNPLVVAVFSWMLRLLAITCYGISGNEIFPDHHYHHHCRCCLCTMQIPVFSSWHIAHYLSIPPPPTYLQLLLLGETSGRLARGRLANEAHDAHGGLVLGQQGGNILDAVRYCEKIIMRVLAPAPDPSRVKLLKCPSTTSWSLASFGWLRNEASSQGKFCSNCLLGENCENSLLVLALSSRLRVHIKGIILRLSTIECSLCLLKHEIIR